MNGNIFKQRKILAVSIIVFLLASLLVFLYFGVSRKSEIKQEERKTDPALAPFVKELEEVKQLEKSQPEQAKARSDALLEKLPEKYRRYIELGYTAAVGPVNLYGKVVDQYGEPVVGARVGFLTGGRFLNPGKGQAAVQTDEEGRFEIHSEGASVQLNGMTLPNINFQFPEHADGGRYGSRIASMTFYDVSPERGRVVPLLSDTSRENPYLFTAWRVEKYERVMKGRVKGNYPTDGKEYFLVLDELNYSKQIQEYAKDAHLRIACERDPMKDYQDKVNWKVTIAPIDGGIQSTDDLYMNLAPDSGYQSTLSIEMRKDSPDYKSILENQRYFFTANNGQIYGSLFVSYKPHIKLNSCIVSIEEYKINTNGSRNLAVKPK